MIVVCGEALVDLVPAQCGGEVGFVARLGGSPFNVAVGLGRLEVPTAYLGRLSEDRFGRELAEHLSGNGVDGRYTLHGPEPTALALVQLSEAGVPEYAFYLERTAESLLLPEHLPERLADEVFALHFGSLGLVLEPGASTLESLMDREHGRRVVTLDPNVRPALIRDRQTYERRLDGWLSRADLVKVSAEDLDWLYPGHPPREVLSDWLARGPGVIVLTQGAAASVAVSDGAEVEVPSSPVAVVDTVGAGDAFMSGLLAWLHRQGRLTLEGLRGMPADDLRQALAWAGRIAAITCTRAGADPPHLAEVDEA
jgi:fructokinase